MSYLILTANQLKGKDRVAVNIEQKTGIYIAYPTSPLLKSIYRPGSYKTKVNDQHTKVGIATKSFASRRKVYFDNFDNEVEFIPITIISSDQLKKAEQLILVEIKRKYKKVGRSREWFNTPKRQEIVEIIISTLAESGIAHEQIPRLENNRYILNTDD